MQTFTGWEYLLIDVANQFGLDKELFDARIQWANDHLETLEDHASEAEEPELYTKACLVIRKAQRGEPTGHLVGLDAVCSGMQIMSAVTGCEAGARATGLIDSDVRADAYSFTTDEMNLILGAGNAYPRKTVKQAVMTVLYGSKKEPKNAFGEDTPELDAFYQAVYRIAPGACELLQDLLESWQPFALSHDWVLPDGFEARVKVMTKVEKRIEVDELDHATFTYEYYENEGSQRGLSNAANVIHSIDAYVLRCLHRRCNYDPHRVRVALEAITDELVIRELGTHVPASDAPIPDELLYYNAQYQRSGMADVVILPWLDRVTAAYLDRQHLEELRRICTAMLQYDPFPVVSIHDESTLGSLVQ